MVCWGVEEAGGGLAAGGPAGPGPAGGAAPPPPPAVGGGGGPAGGDLGVGVAAAAQRGVGGHALFAGQQRGQHRHGVRRRAYADSPVAAGLARRACQVVCVS